MAIERGLTRRLGRELLLQAVYISLAVLVGVFVAARLMEDVLIEQALRGEAEYYWQRETQAPGGPLPDTKNMTGYREGVGAGVPPELAGLPPGFHRREEPRETLTYVTDHAAGRLYLVFEVEQVNELVVLFGIIPLALVLTVIYLSLFSAYRVSRRAVSPMISLAAQVEQLDPAAPDPAVLKRIPALETSDEIRVLADALQGLVQRVGEYAERERNFTRDASHELRTPLTVIKMAADRLLKNEGLAAGDRETLDRIRKSVEDMERLTAAFLLLARESGEGLARDWVCVNEVVASELERARLLRPASNVRTEVLGADRVRVLAPEKVLESVIGNLLRNALAYTDDGSVTVHIGPSSVTIEDTGPGLGKGDVQRMFEPFVRNHRQRGGFGVGLTIVKRLTDRFAWPVRIDSEPGRGTRVTVSFPGARTEPQPPAAPAA
ncbi:MAG: sensor histidine kinase [Xanthomonadales bacterium]|nr:sensor histidine kinase [Xanthomonadales bacterium]NIN58641.1 sensor histidine kinase [Xanthomonadales bacterium]NIN73930.1 sensor histidine kinase [Xanthomonadales bacterium]NIO12399.1 sensor histidine kinase [Xanthomonadales bacterium]NIP11034.1 sensor histidine kinase [Xanthomonadales bacterium]